MTNIVNNKSVFAIVKEVTEGTPVAPSVAADNYIALQTGFSMQPSFNVLENAELTGSIGKAKSIIGAEQPTASINHYFKHSGVEGQEPNVGLLYECALGAKDIESTEYDTVSGSTAGTATTRAIAKVNTGEGSFFRRGQALLIKDATNGYSIRNVFSVATDDLNLNFNLNNAPASGVNLGKCCGYLPANDSHPSFDSWLYRGNGGLVEMMAGSKITNMTISGNANELVNVSFSIEGIAYYQNPLQTTSSKKYIDFNDGGVKVAVVAEKFWKDPHELAAAIQTAMDAASSDTITCTYSNSTGKFTIATNGSTLSLLWNTGTNAANSIGTLIGFSVAADDTAALTYTSDNAITLTAPQTPVYDSSSPLVAKNSQVLLGSFFDNVCFAARSINVACVDTKANLPSFCAESGIAGSVISAREITISITALISQYDVDKFQKFRSNSNLEFMVNLGEKSGGNWVAGTVANIYCPTTSISSMSIEDADGLAQLNLELKGYVENGLGELYINFL